MSGEVAVLPGLAGVRSIAAELDALAEQVAAPASCFSTSVQAFLQPRPEYEAVTITVRTAGRLDAAATLALRPSRLGRQIVKAGTPGEPFRLLACDAVAADRLADGMLVGFARVERNWRSHLADLPARDRVVDQLMRANAYGRRQLAGETPTVWVGEGATHHGVLSRNLRSACSKARNRIAKAGHTLDMRWIRDADRVREVLPLLIELHIRRNEQLREHALMSLKAEQQTFTAVLIGHARAGRLRLLETWIDDRLAAFAACLVSGRRLWAYSNFAHPDALPFSPGTLTNAAVVEAAFEDPEIDLVDWGAGVQRYKLSGGAVLVRSQEIFLWQHRHLALLSQARGYQKRLRARVSRP